MLKAKAAAKSSNSKDLMTVYDTGEYSGFHACCLNCGPAIGNHIVVGA